jgi:hypothetical protein
MAGEEGSVREFSFFKGTENVVASKDGGAFQWNAAATRVRENLHDALNAKNLAFLFGSGCSSVVTGEAQKGIPTMGPLAAEFLNAPPRSSDVVVTNAAAAADVIPPLSAHTTHPKADFEPPNDEERKVLLETLGFDLASAEFANNLERLMEALYSFQFVLRRSSSEALR